MFQSITAEQIRNPYDRQSDDNESIARTKEEIASWLNQMLKSEMRTVLGWLEESSETKTGYRASREIMQNRLAEKATWMLLSPKTLRADLASIEHPIDSQLLALVFYHSDNNWTKLFEVRVEPLDQNTNWGRVNVGARMVCRRK